MSSKSKNKYTHTVTYKTKDGTFKKKTYCWKERYSDYFCESCNITVGYHSKSKHLKSKRHLRTKKLYDEIQKLKSEGLPNIVVL